MRRFAFRLGIALLTLAIGIYSQSFWQAHFVFGLGHLEMPSSPAEIQKHRDELGIHKAVFRYQIEHHPPQIERPNYFLCLGPDNDPDDETLMYLYVLGFHARKISDLASTGELRYGYFQYYESELILRLGDIHRVSDDEVLVGGSYRQWLTGYEETHVYRVVREGREWRVIESESLI
jgi:hypothetical protein